MSGKGVHQALVSRGYEANLIQVDALDDLVSQLRGIDVAFNCLHGGAGEDGTVSLLLEIIGIPTIGSDPLACARAMNKATAKEIFRSLEIPTPKGCAVTADTRGQALDEAQTLGFPLIVKPASAGSTIAVHRVVNVADLNHRLETTLHHFDQILIEQFIVGRELTVGILLLDGVEQALPVIEIRFPDATFNYAAKYTDGVAEFLAPAPIEPEAASQVQAIALRAHQALGCSGFSRVDVRLGEDGIPYVLEVNTLPGMTPLSDLPRAAALVGIEYPDLVELMLSTATIDRNEQPKRDTVPMEDEP